MEDSSDAYDDNRHDGQAVDTVPMDNQWAFGKWFYGPSLDANDMMSPALCRGQKSSRQLPADGSTGRRISVGGEETGSPEVDVAEGLMHQGLFKTGRIDVGLS